MRRRAHKTPRPQHAVDILLSKTQKYKVEELESYAFSDGNLVETQDDKHDEGEGRSKDAAAREYGEHVNAVDAFMNTDEIYRKLSCLEVGSSNRWMTFAIAGTNRKSVLPRMVFLYMIGLPWILAKITAVILMVALTMGTLQFGFVTVVAGTSVPFQANYRRATEFAMNNDGVQTAWDWQAKIVSTLLSIGVFTIRLLVEIWNGFCPFFSLLIDVIYEILKTLVMVWYAAPVLQYFALWLLRLVVFLLEPLLDCCVAILEVFAYVLMDLFHELSELADQDDTDSADSVDAASSSGLTSAFVLQLSLGGIHTVPSSLKEQAIVAETMGYASISDYAFYCEQHPEDIVCTSYNNHPAALEEFLQLHPELDLSPGTGQSPNRRLFQFGNSAGDGIETVGDKLLEIVVIILTAFIRIFQAFATWLLPFTLSFFIQVLPPGIKIVTTLVEFVAELFKILTSDAVLRVLDFLWQALPVIWEVLAAIVCTVITYLGPVLCYLVYGVTIMLGFLLEYIIAPMMCFSSAVVAGCTENFFFRENSGSCTSCGKYNTACGCEDSMLPGRQDCGSGFCVHKDYHAPSVPDCIPSVAGVFDAPWSCSFDPNTDFGPGTLLVMPQLHPTDNPTGHRLASYSNASQAAQTSDSITRYVSGGDGQANFDSQHQQQTSSVHQTTVGGMRVDITASGASGKVYAMSDDPDYGPSPSYTDANPDILPAQHMQWVQNLQHQRQTLLTSGESLHISSLYSDLIQVTASPSLYATVSFDTLNTGGEVLLWGSLPIINSSSSTNVCQFGIDPNTPCTTAIVTEALDLYPDYNPRNLLSSSTTNFENTWQPVFWGVNVIESLAPIKHWNLQCQLPDPVWGVTKARQEVCPWVRLRLPWKHTITAYSLLWQGDADNGLLAPLEYVMYFYTDVYEAHTDNSTLTYTHVSSQCHEHPRLDFVTFGPTQGDSVSHSTLVPDDTVTVALYITKVCHSEAINYLSALQLSSFDVYGHNTSSTLNQSHVSQVSSMETTKPAGIVDYPLIVELLDPTPSLRFWDPCATGTPQVIRDGSNAYAAIFHTTEAEISSFGLHFKTASNLAENIQSLDVVTVHLSDTARIARSTAWLCYNANPSGNLSKAQPPQIQSGNNLLTSTINGKVYKFLTIDTTGEVCVNAENLLSGDTLCTTGLCDFRGSAFHASFQNQLQEMGKGSVQNTYFTSREVPYMTRGASLSFILLPYQPSPPSEFVVWFVPGSFSHLRQTTWQTVLSETAMDWSSAQQNQWMYTVQTDVLNYASSDSFGKYSNTMIYNTDLPTCGWNAYPTAEWIDIAESAHTNFTHVSYWNDPWNNVPSMYWFGIEEVDTITTWHETTNPTETHSSSGRRLQSKHETNSVINTNSSVSEMRSTLAHLYKTQYNASGVEGQPHRYKSPGGNDTAHSMSFNARDIMIDHGLYAKESHTSGAFNRRTMSAPDNSHNQPFHEDLHTMPDPGTEAIFDCVQNFTTERMTCQKRGHAMLPHYTNAKEGNVHQTHLQTDLQDFRRVNHASNISSLAFEHMREYISALYSHTITDNFIESRLKALPLNKLEELVLQMQNERSTQSGQISPRETTGVQNSPATRKLMFLGGGFGWVKDWVIGLLRTFEKLIANALQCNFVCDKDWNSCSGNELGPCLKNYPEFILRGILDCQDANNSLMDCIEMRILEPLLKALLMVLRYILRLFDMFSSIVRGWFGLGDIVQMVACMACRITTIATGVLADFMQSFELSMCTDIVDKGTAQCEKWNLDADSSGFMVFEAMFPLLKVMFGVIQIMPAVWEVVSEVAKLLVSDDTINMIPELLSASFDVILWFVSAEEALPAFLTVLEAFDPAIRGGFMHTMSESTAKPNTQQNGGGDAPSPAPRSTFSTECFTSGQSAATPPVQQGQCTPSFAQATAINPGSRATAMDTGPDDELAWDMGTCSCSIPQKSCEAGQSGCAWQQGDHAKRISEVNQRDAQRTASITTNNTDEWPVCSSSPPRLLPGRGDNQAYKDSNEIQRIPVHSKKCVIETIVPTAHDSRASKAWPFTGFSRRDGQPNTNDPNRRRTVTGGVNGQDYTSQFAPSYPRLGDIHRRRSGGRRLTGIEARVVMGVSDMFSDVDAVTVNAAKNTVKLLMESENKTAAYYQLQGLKSEVYKLMELKNEMLQNITKSASPLAQKAVERVGAVRRLLGLTGVEMKDIGCGYSTRIGPLNNFSAPNTYPCCKGLWCCIPPPFDDDFYIEKDWFAWHDSYHYDNLCPYMETYTGAWLFALRALCKSVRAVGAQTITVVPYNYMFDAFWSIFSFPGDEWPATSSAMIRCTVLNIGAYAILCIAIVVIVLSYPDLSDFAKCNAIILADLSPPKDVQMRVARERANQAAALQRETMPPFHIPDAPPTPPEV